MRRSSRRVDRIRRKDRAGVFILALVVIVVLGAVAFVFRLDGLGVGTCSVSKLRSLTVIAIDATDVLNDVQRLSLHNELIATIGGVPKGGGVQIWRIAPTAGTLPDAAGPLTCNPGDAMTANPWFSNPRLVDRTYSDTFRQPLIAAIDRFIAAQSEPQSPIMESIQSIGVRTFAVAPSRSILSKRLILASDLIQNTSNYSQLHSVEPFEQFARTLNYRRVAPPILSDVSVELLYLQRSNGPSYKQHIEFWQQYFARAGARVDRVVPIVGVS